MHRITKALMGAIALMALVVLFSVGPVRAQVDNSALIAQIKAQIAALVAQLGALQSQQGTGAWCHTFNTNVGVGTSDPNPGGGVPAASGGEVDAVQIALQKSGLSIENGESEVRNKYFGEGTAAAVVTFQQKYGIPTTGFVGPLTRARLNRLYGCGTVLSPVTPTPVSPASRVYENQYMSLKVPSDWRLTEATRTITDQSYNKATGVTTVNRTYTEKTGAVNITKGNYILYINPNASQASGIIGGRFGEIAGGAPSVGAVVKDITFLPCGMKTQQPPTNSSGFSRYDFSVSSATSDPSQCNIPSDGRNAWYFSYMSKDGGYFNTYNNGSVSQVYSDGNNAELVITMAYQASNVNDLPDPNRSDVHLQMMDAMTSIAGTLSLKAWGNAAGQTCGGGFMGVSNLGSQGSCPTGYMCQFPSNHVIGAEDGQCVAAPVTQG